MWLEVRRDVETGLRSGDQGRGGELSYSQHSEDCMNMSCDLPRTDKWRKPVPCDARLSAVFPYGNMAVGSIQNLLWPGLLVTTRTRRNKRRESTSKRTRGVSTWRRARGFCIWNACDALYLSSNILLVTVLVWVKWRTKSFVMRKEDISIKWLQKI